MELANVSLNPEIVFGFVDKLTNHEPKEARMLENEENIDSNRDKNEKIVKGGNDEPFELLMLKESAAQASKLSLFNYFLRYISTFSRKKMGYINFYLALSEWKELCMVDIDKARVKSLEIHKCFGRKGAPESVDVSEIIENLKILTESSYTALMNELEVRIKTIFNQFKENPLYHDYIESQNFQGGKGFSLEANVRMETLKDIEPLDTLFFMDGFKNLIALSECVPHYNSKEFASVVSSVLFSTGHITSFIRTLARREVMECRDPHTLFRNNTIADQILTSFIQKASEDNLNEFLKNSPLNAIARSKQLLELDPLRVKSEKVQANNFREVKKVVSQMVLKFHKNPHLFPVPVRIIIREIFELITSKFEGIDGLPRKVIGGVLFLRIIAPAIVKPATYGIDENAYFNSRSLLFVAKLIQSLSNHVLFTTKDEHLNPLNKFLERKFPAIDNFLVQQYATQREQMEYQRKLPLLVPEDAAYLTMMLAKHLDEMKRDYDVTYFHSQIRLAQRKWPAPTRRDRDLEQYFRKFKGDAELNIKFRKLFSLKRDTLSLVVRCSLEGAVPIHGSLYVSKSAICFYGGVFAIKRKEVLRFSDIDIIEPTSYGSNVLENTQIMIKMKAMQTGKVKMYIFNCDKDDIPRKHIYAIMKFHWRDDLEKGSGYHSLQRINEGESESEKSSSDTSKSEIDSTQSSSSSVVSKSSSKGNVFKKMKRRVSFTKTSIPDYIIRDTTNGEDIQIDGANWETILRISKELLFTRDEMILEAGYRSNSLYTITTGRVNVRITDKGVQRVVRTMDVGDIFAEMSFLDGSSVSADIIAESETVSVMMISRPAVDSIAFTHPAFAFSLYMKLGGTIAERMVSNDHAEKNLIGTAVLSCKKDSIPCYVATTGVSLPGFFRYDETGIEYEATVFGVSVFASFKYNEISNVELDDDGNLCILYCDKALDEEIIEFDDHEDVTLVLKNVFFYITKLKYYNNNPKLVQPDDATENDEVDTRKRESIGESEVCTVTSKRNWENSADFPSLIQFLNYVSVKRISQNRTANLSIGRNIYYICKGCIESGEKSRFERCSIVGAHEFLIGDRSVEISVKTLSDTCLLMLSEEGMREMIKIGEVVPLKIVQCIDMLLSEQLRQNHNE